MVWNFVQEKIESLVFATAKTAQVAKTAGTRINIFQYGSISDTGEVHVSIGPFIATQLNSTQVDVDLSSVELSWV